MAGLGLFDFLVHWPNKRESGIDIPGNSGDLHILCHLGPFYKHQWDNEEDKG